MDTQKDMSFWAHLMEFRKKLVIIIVCHLLVAVVLFPLADQALPFFLNLNPDFNLVYITPAEMLLLYIQIDLVATVILCLPLTVLLVWSFVATGLYRREKVAIALALIAGLGMFALGVFFAYRVIVPILLAYFQGLSATTIPSMISVREFVGFVLSVFVIFGTVFEMPVLVFLLTAMGIIDAGTLWRKQRLYIVVIVILAAFFTPPDVLSQMLMAVPMFLLFELSMAIAWLVGRFQKRKTRKNEEKME